MNKSIGVPCILGSNGEESSVYTSDEILDRPTGMRFEYMHCDYIYQVARPKPFVTSLSSTSIVFLRIPSSAIQRVPLVKMHMGAYCRRNRSRLYGSLMQLRCAIAVLGVLREWQGHINCNKYSIDLLTLCFSHLLLDPGYVISRGLS